MKKKIINFMLKIFRILKTLKTNIYILEETVTKWISRKIFILKFVLGLIINQVRLMGQFITVQGPKKIYCEDENMVVAKKVFDNICCYGGETRNLIWKRKI